MEYGQAHSCIAVHCSVSHTRHRSPDHRKHFSKTILGPVNYNWLDCKTFHSTQALSKEKVEEGGVRKRWLL